ncbi:hypothetical protein HMI54_006378 [Coelomomyces lativittatus]|nr:hypothetical protein HMI54_006378 [Coelomomyces lativittatus]
MISSFGVDLFFGKRAADKSSADSEIQQEYVYFFNKTLSSKPASEVMNTFNDVRLTKDILEYLEIESTNILNKKLEGKIHLSKGGYLKGSIKLKGDALGRAKCWIYASEGRIKDTSKKPEGYSIGYCSGLFCHKKFKTYLPESIFSVDISIKNIFFVVQCNIDQKILEPYIRQVEIEFPAKNSLSADYAEKLKNLDDLFRDKDNSKIDNSFFHLFGTILYFRYVKTIREIS